MIDPAKLKPGDKVHYKPAHFGDDEWENGIVKEVREAFPNSLKSRTIVVFVVYNCNKDWDNYQNYTAAATHSNDLFLGWRDDEEEN